jgi:hypothetical protein
MRKVFPVLAIAVVSLAIYAATAGAVSASRFSVETIATAAHQTPDHHFVERGKLVEPGEVSEVVGAYKGRFSRTGHTRLVLFFPDGKIKANGDQGRELKIPIVGGTRRWDGASGKVKFTYLPHNRALLTLTVVQ